jgi:hypothetical protein
MKRVGQIHQEGPDGRFNLVVVHGQFEKSSNVFYSKNLVANNITRTDYRYSVKLWSATLRINVSSRGMSYRYGHILGYPQRAEKTFLEGSLFLRDPAGPVSKP